VPIESTITMASGADSRTLASSVEESMRRGADENYSEGGESATEKEGPEAVSKERHHQVSAGSRTEKQAPRDMLGR
jgi:hypothetical protein